MKSDEGTGSTPLTPQLLYALRYYFGNRKVLIALAVVALLGGMILNWNWLVAAGLAPIILALAPCAAMCAAGLCMSKMGQKSCDSQTRTVNDPVSKVLAGPDIRETQALSSATPTAVQPSTSEAGSEAPPKPSAAAEREISVNPTIRTGEKSDA